MANVNGQTNLLEKKEQPKQPTTVKAFLETPSIKKRFEQVLNKRAPQYMSSIVNLVTSDVNLQKCEPMSIIGSCMLAATMDLPVDKNLGYAWVIPYGNKAQFQIGYKGIIQLALRSGQYKYINAIEVYEGELVSFDRLTEELVIDFNQRKSEKVVGYAAYFELLNGFKKTVYWTREQVEKHRDRFSKAKNYGPWKDDFDSMALKTVLKNMLSKWGILSIEMQSAQLHDEQTAVPSETDGEIVDVDFTLEPEVVTE